MRNKGLLVPRASIPKVESEIKSRVSIYSTLPRRVLLGNRFNLGGYRVRDKEEVHALQGTLVGLTGEELSEHQVKRKVARAENKEKKKVKKGKGYPSV